MPATDQLATSNLSKQDPPPRVLLWGTYDSGKPRIRILRKGMQASGISLTEVHANFWNEVKDKSQIRGIGATLKLLTKSVCAYGRLMLLSCKTNRPDAILVSYPGVIDIFPAWALSRLWRIPLYFDVFISMYDTIVLDRRLIHPSSSIAKLLFWWERCCIRLADQPFMDTAAHARRIEELFALPSGSCGRIWVGAETHTFRPHSSQAMTAGRQPGLNVLFYGQFIPLHGLPIIIEAARLLSDQAVNFTIIGHGQETARIHSMMQAAPLPRVRMLDWVKYEDLNLQLQSADVCLGIFGTSEKAASVIPNKIFQIIAAGRPFITRDSPAMRELLPMPRQDAILIPAGDAAALATALQVFLDHKCDPGGMQRRHHDLQELIDPKAIGHQFRLLLADFRRPSCNR